MPRWACTSTSPCPSPATCSRTPGKLAFPFRRYQIQKVWRGERPQEGRFREFTQADIDVVDVGELAPHFEAEMPLVIAEAFSRLPVGEFRIQVNNRKIPEGFYLGIGLTDVATTLRIVDKLGQDRAPARSPRCSSSRERARTRPARCWPWPRSAAPTSPSWMPCAPWACSTRRSTRVSRRCRRSSPPGWSRRPGCSSPTCSIARGLDYYTGTVYETQLVGSESWGSVCSGGRYDSLATDGRTTYPGVGISIGLTRLVHLLVSQARAHREPLDAGRGARRRERRVEPRGVRRVAAALRARGIPCEVAPSAARFGKQIRYADRRGIPYVWFPGAGERGDQVKDIRSGSRWMRPQVRGSVPWRTFGRRSSPRSTSGLRHVPLFVTATLLPLGRLPRWHVLRRTCCPAQRCSYGRTNGR